MLCVCVVKWFWAQQWAAVEIRIFDFLHGMFCQPMFECILSKIALQSWKQQVCFSQCDDFWVFTNWNAIFSNTTLLCFTESWLKRLDQIHLAQHLAMILGKCLFTRNVTRLQKKFSSEKSVVISTNWWMFSGKTACLAFETGGHLCVIVQLRASCHELTAGIWENVVWQWSLSTILRSWG